MTTTSAEHHDGISAAPAEKPSRRRRSTVPSLDRVVPSAGSPRGSGAVEAILAVRPGDRLVDVAVATIDPHPDNPRDDLGDLTEMVDSIQGIGVLEPLIIATSTAFRTARGEVDVVDDGRFVTIAGHRRAAAAEKAGLFTVPAIIRDDLAGDQGVAAMLVENLHREGLKPLEEARAYRKLEELGHNQTAIAKLVGRSQADVSKKLALLKLPRSVQAGVLEGQVSIEDAAKMAKYADDKEILSRVQSRASYETVDQAAEKVRTQRKRDAETAAAVEKAKKAGYTGRVVPYPSGNVFTDLTQRLRFGTGPVTVEGLAKGGVDIRDHEALPCHARAIGYDGNSFNPQLHDVVICTKPEIHRGESSVGKQKVAAERKQAREKAQREAQATARRQLVTAAIAGKPSKALEELLDAALVEMLDQFLDEEALTAALAFLGLDVGDEGAYAGDVWRAYLDKAPANRPRAIAAALLGDIENDLARGYVRSTHGGAYVRWLQSLGHTLKGEERKIAQAKS